MSNNKPQIVQPASEPTEVKEKPTFVQKSKAFARKHKKPLIAMGALTALVAIASKTGPKVERHLDFEYRAEPVDDYDESDDTQSA